MKSVLIVEDDPIIADEIRELLEDDGNYAILGIISSGRKAVAAIREDLPDLVLLDIVLPDFTGLSVLRECKRSGIKTNFLVVSSFEDTSKIFDAILEGANGYITKERLDLELIPSITDILNGGSPMSSTVARKALESFRNKIRPRVDVAELSPREEEIMRAFAHGSSYKEISEELFISIETVKTHIRNVYKKLQVNSRSDLRKLL
jgi:DNA-binding NarL/FixJ family response regulator